MKQFLILLGLVACCFSGRTAEYTSEKFEKIKVGMGASDVVAIIGNPATEARLNNELTSLSWSKSRYGKTSVAMVWLKSGFVCIAPREIFKDKSLQELKQIYLSPASNSTNETPKKADSQPRKTEEKPEKTPPDSSAKDKKKSAREGFREAFDELKNTGKSLEKIWSPPDTDNSLESLFAPSKISKERTEVMSKAFDQADRQAYVEIYPEMSDELKQKVLSGSESLELIDKKRLVEELYWAEQRQQKATREYRNIYISLHDDLSQEFAYAIQHGKILVGMTGEDVETSWGKPAEIETSVNASGSYDLWSYPGSNAVLTLENDRLVSWTITKKQAERRLPRMEAAYTPDNLEKLQLGVSDYEVIGIMGPPAHRSRREDGAVT